MPGGLAAPRPLSPSGISSSINPPSFPACGYQPRAPSQLSKKSNLCPTSTSTTPPPWPRAPTSFGKPCWNGGGHEGTRWADVEVPKLTPFSLFLCLSPGRCRASLREGAWRLKTLRAEIWAVKRLFWNQQGSAQSRSPSLLDSWHSPGPWRVARSATHCRIAKARK